MISASFVGCDNLLEVPLEWLDRLIYDNQHYGTDLYLPTGNGRASLDQELAAATDYRYLLEHEEVCQFRSRHGKDMNSFYGMLWQDSPLSLFSAGRELMGYDNPYVL